MPIRSAPAAQAQGEAELRRTQELLQGILDNSTAVIFAKEHASRVVGRGYIPPTGGIIPSCCISAKLSEQSQSSAILPPRRR